MTQAPAFKIRYWGVTGTFSDPLMPHEVTDKIVGAIRILTEKKQLKDLQEGPGLEATIREIVQRELPFHQRSTYGGNTTCIEVQTADNLFIFDCGSGFRELGTDLGMRWRDQGEAAVRSAHVMLTHAHMDHTFATPFFSPYYNPNNNFTMCGPRMAIESLQAVLDPNSPLSQIYFPPTYNEMMALHHFQILEPGSEFQIGATHIRTYALNHPGGSMAYRLETAGASFVFATDHEPLENPDSGLIEFARGCDLLYTEGQYTQAEYEGQTGIGDEAGFSRKGWGHSPVEACIRTAVAANVRQLHLGHRDPRRDDEHIAELAFYVQKFLSETAAAAGHADCQVAIPYEGMEVEIPAR